MGLIKAPVTALGFAGNFLVAGVGSFVRFYGKWSRKAVLNEKVFEHDVIHGFSFLVAGEEHCVAIFGGREICICKLHPSGNEHISVTTISRRKTADWIWDCAFIFQSDTDVNAVPEHIALALGHNSVILFDWMNAVTISDSRCEEKCILYSAHFIKEERPTWDSLTLCSGTVFNQVVIWKPGSVENGSSAAKVIERIQAHDGVIFSMDFDFLSGYLVTASDDRSIRLWTCKSLQSFCSKPVKEEILSSSTNLCKLYGHESRVWRAKCLKYSANQYLISIGEDGYCIVWSLERHSDGKLLNGAITKKVRSHKGRNIWSMAIDQTNGCIATGGGDTGIRFFAVKDLVSNSAVITTHPFGECESADSNGIMKGRGVLKSIHMCDRGVILGHTYSGVLLRFDMDKSSWTVLYSNEHFKSYAIMRVCDEMNAVAIANTVGKVNILHACRTWNEVISKSEFQAPTSTGKIHNMTWFMCGDIPYLLISGQDGEFLCFSISIPTCSQTRIFSWVLPPAKHRWHMGAVLISMNGLNYAICGDRRGSLHLFKQGTKEPLHTLHGVHGKSGVTSLQILNRSVISTGRDGIWRKIEVNSDSESINVISQNRAAQGMDWLVSALILPNIYVNDLFILGFHGRNFMIWSSSTNDTLLSVECGGGHRDWSFGVENEKSCLAFIKESTLNLAVVHRDVTKQTSVVESHFHGGKITNLKHIDSYFDVHGNISVSFLATGSEDTRIFISAILHHAESTTESELHLVHLIEDHISSVRALSTVTLWSNNYGSSTLLFTGGGRATVNSYLVTIKYSECWKESCKVEPVSSHHLNAKSEKSKSKDTYSANPETRYMDLSALNKDGMVTIAAACSDAVVRLFQLDIDKKELKLVAQSSVHSHCFLTIRILELDKMVYLLLGSTDGILRICPAGSMTSYSDSTVTGMKNLPPPLLETQAHMSGINSMDIAQCPSSLCSKDILLQENSVLVVTGGDDNSIHIFLSTLENGLFKNSHTCTIPDAHSTQITGLRLMEHVEGIGLISTSIDQRITKWKIFFEEAELKCQFVSSTLTNVADVSSLEVWECKTLNEGRSKITSYAVCGQGIQIFDSEFT